MAQKLARRAVAAYVADQLAAGTPVRDLVDQVSAYLIDQRQTGSVDNLIRDIQVAVLRRHGVASIELTTAHELDDAVRQELCTLVAAKTGAKTAVIQAEQVDASLIGGVIARTPESSIDTSVRTQLKQLVAKTKGL